MAGALDQGQNEKGAEIEVDLDYFSFLGPHPVDPYASGAQIEGKGHQVYLHHGILICVQITVAVYVRDGSSDF